MKDLLEVVVSIGVSVLLIGATYSLLGTWLTNLVNQAFTLAAQ